MDLLRRLPVMVTVLQCLSFFIPGAILAPQEDTEIIIDPVLPCDLFPDGNCVKFCGCPNKFCPDVIFPDTLPVSLPEPGPSPDAILSCACAALQLSSRCVPIECFGPYDLTLGNVCDNLCPIATEG
ncbi:hypothetical protein GDO81_029176 [Engystomops pustulosus]|uniref:Uncharacterized protein n=1 Tax=Engystomops pustulosus TaxID=76066 RepID=A0AAV6ZKZ5_ENGPU|nr:hypothetical protein GDO81_029176 [Engystomops pustulosus]KAG8550047.1 hypothetical protein GDO81_029176 [Engystomops pustulosus]